MDYLDALEFGEKQDRRGSGRKGVRTNKTRGHIGCTGRCGMCSASISHKSLVRLRKRRYDGDRIVLDVSVGKFPVEYFVNSGRPADVQNRAVHLGKSHYRW